VALLVVRLAGADATEAAGMLERCDMWVGISSVMCVSLQPR